MKMFIQGMMIVTSLVIVTPVQAADLPEIVNCAGYTCRKAPMKTYTAQLGATCLEVYKKLNFVSIQQMVAINKDKTGLSCAKALRQGQIICYPQTKSDAGC